MNIAKSIKKILKKDPKPGDKLKNKILKSHTKKLERDVFRKKIAEQEGVNWKRVRITNWQTKEFYISSNK